MNQYKEKVIGDHGTYNSMEEWQKAERPLEYHFQRNTPTLEDQFAMAALQGMLASGNRPKNGTSAENFAESAYYHAKAMMKEREKK